MGELRCVTAVTVYSRATAPCPSPFSLFSPQAPHNEMNLGLDGARVLVTAGGAGIGLAMRASHSEDARARCDRSGALSALRRATLRCRTHADVSMKPVARLFAAAVTHLLGLRAVNDEYRRSDRRCEDTRAPTGNARGRNGRVILSRGCDPTCWPAPTQARICPSPGRFGFPLRTPYAASKWAVIGFTKSLSIELGSDGIRVNAICPGSVAGPRIDSVFANKAAARGVSMETVRDEALTKTSLHRLIAPEDIARTIVFLASPAAANISGQAIGVDADVQSLV